MEIDVETRRLLENWARYRIGWTSHGLGYGNSVLANLESRGRRDGVKIPVLAGEGFDVDQVVRALPTPHERFLVAEFIKTGTQYQRAKWAGCSVNSYRDRTEKAVYAFKSAWYEKKRNKGASHLTKILA